jgi:hypothetical protein
MSYSLKEFVSQIMKSMEDLRSHLSHHEEKQTAYCVILGHNWQLILPVLYVKLNVVLIIVHIILPRELWNENC